MLSTVYIRTRIEPTLSLVILEIAGYDLEKGFAGTCRLISHDLVSFKPLNRRED